MQLPKIALGLAVASVLSLAACGDDVAGTYNVTGSASTAAAIDDADAASGNGEANAAPTAAGSDTMPSVAMVTIARSRFDTRELRVAPGTTVVFENTDEFAHTVTSADGSPISFDSAELLQGDTFAITFDEPGEYPYFCQIHPTMRATVIVG